MYTESYYMNSNITDIFNLGIDFVFFLGFVSHGYVRGGRGKGAMGERREQWEGERG